MKKDTTKIKIEIDIKSYFETGIRDFAFNLIEKITDWNEIWRYRIQLITDELCNNAIEHGSESNSKIIIDFEYIQNEFIKISVSDFGKINSKIKAKDIIKTMEENSLKKQNELGIRGRGLAFIIKKWCDSLEIQDNQYGGVTVSITKSKENTIIENPQRTLEEKTIII